jgi:predicted house-cleaning noncanonical NTP pyrophosphatase (MazG superfamily)
MKYHKLVRDRIPEIIEASGKNCKIEILSDEEYLRMVDAKLDEELAEYHKDQNIEELADLMEVIYAAAIARGYTIEQLEQVRAEKAAKRGGFQKRILLKEVIGQEESNLPELIHKNQDTILSQLDTNTLSVYRWLQDNLHTRNVAIDQEYRKRYGHYYGMRFVSNEYRERYFQMMEDLKNTPGVSFREISQQLYLVDQKHEFSFISKLLHTIDPSCPIYDSRVARVLGITRYPKSDFQKVLKRDEGILDKLRNVYHQLETDSRLTELLIQIDQRTPDKPMSIEKKLDFILWALGGIIK